MVILSIAQLQETPSQYLQRRFNNTVIRTERLGVVYVEQVHENKVFSVRQFTDLGHLQGDVKHVGIEGIGSIVEARPKTGLINTRWGVLQITDKAGHQWSWGCCTNRFRIESFVTHDDGYRHDTAGVFWYMFQDEQETYYQQWLNDVVHIAINRNLCLKLDSSKKKQSFLSRYAGGRPAAAWELSLLGVDTSTEFKFKMEGLV